jgi:mycofactocin system FadH/OYE family oxidoreductase 2
VNATPDAHRFPRLFSPFQLGPVTLKNRLVLLPHLVQYARDHLPSEQEVHYYRERARGGVGLIIWGSQSVQPGSTLHSDIYACDSRARSGYQRVADAVHAHGAQILAQLTHYGNQALSDVTLELEDWTMPPIAPSPVPDGFIGAVPRPMDERTIRDVIAAFAVSSENVVAGGLDGVEVQVGHAGLLRQFLSPFTNRRTDRYGGSLENRMRFVVEVLEAVRAAIGRDRVLGVRLCCDEDLEGGLQVRDAVEIARRLDATGLLDYLSSDIGVLSSPDLMNPSMTTPPGYALHTAVALKRATDLPVIAFGRITQPGHAEHILEHGMADLVGMARQLICDPETPRKAEEGRAEEIRYCMGCNQACYGRTWRNQPISCTHNPAAGRERLWGAGTLDRAATARRVLVVGGGPAGMKAATVAAQRGHEVVLVEASERLGGQITQFAAAPGRDGFLECVLYLEGLIGRLRIETLLGEEATPALIAGHAPDVVVVATGSRPVSELGSPCDVPVHSAADVARGAAVPGGHVLVVDRDGHWSAGSAAETLLAAGAQVTCITHFETFCPEIDIPARAALLGRLGLGSAKILTSVHLAGVGDGRPRLESLLPLNWADLDPVDAVVVAGGAEPVNGLIDELQALGGFEVLGAGDAVLPRRVDHAIIEGEQIGRAI